jgi:hypothetical protein
MAVDGTYDFTLQTPMGPQKGKMVLETNGNTITGSFQGMMGVDPIQTGTANGDEFECLVEARSPMGPIKVTVKAKVEGDTLSGTATTPFGPAPLTGTRV